MSESEQKQMTIKTVHGDREFNTTIMQAGKRVAVCIGRTAEESERRANCIVKGDAAAGELDQTNKQIKQLRAEIDQLKQEPALSPQLESAEALNKKLQSEIDKLKATVAADKKTPGK